MTSIDHTGLRTWIEVDTQTIKHNIDQFRNLLDEKTKLAIVVKSNAYGHDFMQFAKEAEKQKVDYLIVDSITEGVRLRKEGIKTPLLILGYTLPERIAEAVEYDIDISVSSFEALRASSVLGQSGAKPKIHIKVDTGMSRQGFLEKDRENLINELSRSHVDVVGLFTHFASAKNPTLPHDTQKQINRFTEWQKDFEKAGLTPMTHAGATSGLLLYPEAHFDMVRVGIGAYGLWPSQEARSFLEQKVSLKTVLSWKTIISEVKEVSKGERVGYDFTEILDRDSVLAICPVGYWHGISRKLSGIGKVLVRGQKARIIGRVSMDIIILDVTDIPDVSVSDVVTLIGKDGDSEITAYDMAHLDDTNWYETVTRINPLIKRIYF